MSNLKLKTGISLSLLLVVPALFIVLFLCVNSCEAKEPAPNPAITEAVKQARTLQKEGDMEQAILLFEQYAAQGNPSAMFHAGKSYSRGWGVKPDLVKAEHYFTSAIEYDFPKRGETAYELGRLFQRSIGPDCDTIAVEWFEKAMQWQFLKASLQLAIHYEKGLGVDQDIKKAVKNYEIATHAGYEQALLKYARILLEGSYDITPNPQRAELLTQEAIVTLERKARAGSASAAKQLGRIYKKGQLVPADLEKAEKWLLQSARSGSTGGMHDIARLMLADKTNTARYSEAIDWLRAAAERGHGGAMTTLGRLHLAQKHNLTQDEAVGWFEMGTKAGHGGSMQELAELYEQGLLVTQDLDEAIKLARMGRDQGHSGCARLLALLLEKNEVGAEPTSASANL